MRQKSLLPIFLLLGACTASEDGRSLPDGGIDGSCTGLTPSYQDCIQPLVAARCLSCHSVEKTGAARLDAPDGVNFDTEPELQRWAARILVRAIEVADMPPTGPLTAEEQAMLQAYLENLATQPCMPACNGLSCGDDGCGGVCGTCPQGDICQTGSCQTLPCAPSCVGKACGGDGCGGSCGTCTDPQTCSISGICVCMPNCTGKQCGDDGCGGTCGSCPGMLVCNSRQGRCSANCNPDCSGRVCGNDGCEGSCGTCASGEQCSSAGQCGCATNCTNNACGDDGCGGLCGTCDPGSECVNGACVWPSASFSQDVMPIFDRAGVECGSSVCHGGNAPKAGLDMSSVQKAYSDLVGVPATQCSTRLRVDPGQPSSSYLINKLTGIGLCFGSRMPKADAPLSDQEISIVRAWIGNGAAND